MRVRWTPAAASGLEQISNYLKEHHPSLAHATAMKLYNAAQSLKKFLGADGSGNWQARENW